MDLHTTQRRKRQPSIRRLAASLLIGTALAASVLAVSSPAGAVIRINDGDDCPRIIAPVVNLYTAFFLREPDPQGLDYWVQFVSSSEGSLSAAATAFAGSPEFIDRYGEMTTEEFVAQLYPNVFGRAPDAGGLAFWINNIESGTRTRSEVIVVWSLSPEFAGENISDSPLIYDLARQEVWCGSGQGVIEADRISLEVAQRISVRPVDPEIENQASAAIQGLAANGTVVIETANRLDGYGGVSIYVHPNLGQVIDRYRIQVNEFDAAGTEPTEWVILSEWIPPPWRTF